MLDSRTPFPCPKSTAYSVASGIESNSACLSLFRALGDPACGPEPKVTVDQMKTTESALQLLHSKEEGLQREKEKDSYMAPDAGLYRAVSPVGTTV